MTHVPLSRTLTDLKPGDHLCCLYETEQEHRAVLTPFLRQGLERGEKVLYIADDHAAQTALSYLWDDGLEMEPYLARGQLSILSPHDTYVQDGAFDPDRMIALLQAETERALAEGYAALRVAGEMTWALGCGRLIEYEARLNGFFPGSRCLAICQYDRRRFDPQVLLDVLRTHPVAVVGTEVCDNFYYVPPVELLDPDPAAAQLRHWMRNLAERQQMGKTLREQAHDLGERVKELDCLYAIFKLVEKPGLSCEEVLQSVVDLTPSAWQYPQIACARLLLEGQAFQTSNFKETIWKQASDVMLHGDRIGTLEVCYLEEKPDSDAGPFLKEEQSLLNAIAEQLGRIIECQRAEVEIQASTQRLLTVVETVGEGITLSDGAGYFEIFNSKMTEITGYSREQANDCHDFLALLYPDPDERLAASVGIQEVMQRGGYRDVQTTICTKEGCLKDLLVSTSIVRHQGRDWLLSAYRDITERVQAEEALQESEVRYRTLVEQIPAITYTAALDEAGTTLYISPQVRTYLGYSQQDYEIDPDSWRKALYPEDYARVMEQVAQSQAEGGPFVSEYRMITRDDRVVWFRDEGVVVRDDAGCPLFLQGVMFDITERKEAEEALQKAKEELENKNTRLEALYRVGQIINSTLESNAILDRLTDEAMRVTRATHGQVLVVREEQGHFERRSLRGFSPQETELARTVPLPLDQGMNGRVYVTRQSACLDDVRTDPSYFPLIPATRTELAVPIIRAGRILGNLDLQSPELGAFRDVELDYLSALADQVAIALENARIFRAVEQSRRDWETTFDAMQDVVALVDRERRIVRVNQAFADIVHSPSSQVVGQMHHAVLGGENCPEVDCCPLEQTMESGQPARCIHEYGGRVFEVQTTPVWERNGGEPDCVAHMVYVMRDITERMQADEALRRTERLAAMGRLAAALTHEINNPLQAIRSNLELVLSFDLEPDEREGYLYVCHQEIERLAEISQCVLSFARPARDARRPTSLAHLIQRTLALVGKQLQHANVQVAIDLPIDMPPIMVAPDQIVQVLLNFMINAAEIMPDGGLISVKADQDRDAMVLTLANDGPHIPPEHIEHIFDPFFTTKPDGTGLGLSISHSIIQGHGGAIHVENLAGERGVRFIITLPIAPPVETYEVVA